MTCESSGFVTSCGGVALAGGLAIGTLGHGSSAVGFTIFGQIVDPLGRLWLSSLQMTVLPLVVVYLLAAIVGAGGRETLGTLGTRAVGLFIVMLVIAALFTLVVSPPLIAATAPAASAFDALRQATAVPQAAREAAAAAPKLHRPHRSPGANHNRRLNRLQADRSPPGRRLSLRA